VSFFPSKNLGAAGDGGMVVTNDPERAERVRCRRAHGAKPKYYHKVLGGNFRLDTIQAAVVSAKLPHLDSWTAARQRHAQQYDLLFAEAGLATVGPPHERRVGLPHVVTDRHVFNQYVIRVSERDHLKAALQSCGVGTEVYYPVPMHLQECFAYLGHGVGAFPESERAARETLAIPVHPELSEAQARYVVGCLRDLLLADAQAVA
jgi:dTDP-4-amino-4,6-dideoxygalactose transaminase